MGEATTDIGEMSKCKWTLPIGQKRKGRCGSCAVILIQPPTLFSRLLHKLHLGFSAHEPPTSSLNLSKCICCKLGCRFGQVGDICFICGRPRGYVANLYNTYVFRVPGRNHHSWKSIDGLRIRMQVHHTGMCHL